MQLTYFAEIILPLAVEETYTYRVPNEMVADIAVGKRVVVQFTRNKLYAGIVERIHNDAPTKFQAKYVDAVIDENPIVNQVQMRFWAWVAQYYCCSLGEVFLAAVPASLRMSSETVVSAVSLDIDELATLNLAEQTIYEYVQSKEAITLHDLFKHSQNRNVFALVKQMNEKGFLVLEESLNQKYSAKKVPFLKLANALFKPAVLEDWFNKLSKAPKQADALMAYLSAFVALGNKYDWIKKSELTVKGNISAAALKSLVQKGVLVEEQMAIDRLDFALHADDAPVNLSDYQTEKKEAIDKAFETTDIALLHGVTGSGKTEIYLKLIQEVIAKGQQVLYLVPEIALTTQLLKRLRKHLGTKVGVYHSKYSSNERAELWFKTLNKDGVQVIIGPRSAMFLPFSDLGLIVVDEEHESSFKQYEPAPRYQARDSAILLAKYHNAKLLLGSATPSIEAFWMCKTGKAALIEMSKRYGKAKLPTLQLVDLSAKGERKGEFFSETLLTKIAQLLEQKEQVILFQNRRGFAPSWQCKTCGWVPYCANCDISLTYHKYRNVMLCHYCAHTAPTPEKCGACGSPEMTMMGFGTERVEEDLSIIFPDAKIARLDQDTTRGKNALSKLIEDFENHDIDILVGTQMVTKGLDFENVGLVGILSADHILSFPDFRAFERSYQLMTQVAGRAGRKDKLGEVLIQTYDPSHKILKYVLEQDYEGMYTEEITEREQLSYPPLCRLIRITIKHKDKVLCQQAAEYFATMLRKAFGEERVLGPEAGLIERIRNQYIQNTLLKIERKYSPKQSKVYLHEAIQNMRLHARFKPVRIIIDVDPY